jgi:hypothetical protein
VRRKHLVGMIVLSGLIIFLVQFYQSNDSLTQTTPTDVGIVARCTSTLFQQTCSTIVTNMDGILVERHDTQPTFFARLTVGILFGALLYALLGGRRINFDE